MPPIVPAPPLQEPSPSSSTERLLTTKQHSSPASGDSAGEHQSRSTKDSSDTPLHSDAAPPGPAQSPNPNTYAAASASTADAAAPAPHPSTSTGAGKPPRKRMSRTPRDRMSLDVAAELAYQRAAEGEREPVGNRWHRAIRKVMGRFG